MLDNIANFMTYMLGQLDEPELEVLHTSDTYKITGHKHSDGENACYFSSTPLTRLAYSIEHEEDCREALELRPFDLPGIRQIRLNHHEAEALEFLEGQARKLIAGIHAIEGVESFRFINHQLSLTKRAAFEWSEIESLVLDLLIDLYAPLTLPEWDAEYTPINKIVLKRPAAHVLEFNVRTRLTSIDIAIPIYIALGLEEDLLASPGLQTFCHALFQLPGVSKIIVEDYQLTVLIVDEVYQPDELVPTITHRLDEYLSTLG